MKFTSKLITNVGKVRAANEDNMGEAITPNGHLFVVCDGMGGHVGGATASSIAVTSIIEFFKREVYDNAIQAIDHALSFANEQIYASALNNPELKGMGTTAVVLLIRNEDCFIGHVGDSRIYLYSDGKLNRLTKDHSFVQTLVDSGIISDDEAESHPNKNQILQALGIASSVKGTISPAAISPKNGDTFLLCSDGLNGMVKDGDMQHILSVNNIEIAAENLITAALNAGGTDNITVALVKIEESVHTKSTFSHFNPILKPDFVSTQQIGGKTNTIPTNNNKKWMVIGGALLAVVVSIVLYVRLTGNEKSSISKSDEIDKITKEKIEQCPEENQNDLLDKKYHVANDTIVIKGSGDLAVVKESLVVKISPKAETKVKIEVDKIENKATPKEQVKKKKQIENTDNQRVLKKHKVAKGEGLQAIVNKYKSLCPNLNEEKLKDHNVNSKNFTGDRGKLERGELINGWVLEIPCE